MHYPGISKTSLKKNFTKFDNNILRDPDLTAQKNQTYFTLAL